MSNAVSPKDISATLTEFWSPRIIGELDDSYIKVAKLQGSLTWHSHDEQDELFLVLKGRLRIEMEAGAVELVEGEMYVVAKGIRHNPVAEGECQVMLIERKSTSHTGKVVVEGTRSLADQLRPL
jgi:mannose-6-phosphate isomerase-like protein (cupin superfamily)